jgi:hypothetical protein
VIGTLGRPLKSEHPVSTSHRIIRLSRHGVLIEHQRWPGTKPYEKETAIVVTTLVRGWPARREDPATVPASTTRQGSII